MAELCNFKNLKAREALHYVKKSKKTKKIFYKI